MDIKIKNIATIVKSFIQLTNESGDLSHYMSLNLEMKRGYIKAMADHLRVKLTHEEETQVFEYLETFKDG